MPHVPTGERVTLDDLGYRDDGITHLTVRYGFQDTIDVPGRRCAARRGQARVATVDLDGVSYFISRITIVADRRAGDGAVAQEAVPAIARNAADPVPYFGLPDERTTVMGSHIEL